MTFYETGRRVFGEPYMSVEPNRPLQMGSHKGWFNGDDGSWEKTIVTLGKNEEGKSQLTVTFVNNADKPPIVVPDGRLSTEFVSGEIFTGPRMLRRRVYSVVSSITVKYY